MYIWQSLQLLDPTRPFSGRGTVSRSSQILGQVRFSGGDRAPARMLLRAAGHQILVSLPAVRWPVSPSPRIPGEGHFSRRDRGPCTAPCCVTPNFGLPAIVAMASILASPDTGLRPFFQDPTGAMARTRFYGAGHQISLPSSRGRAGISLPQNTRPRPFFRDATGARTSTLLWAPNWCACPWGRVRISVPLNRPTGPRPFLGRYRGPRQSAAPCHITPNFETVFSGHDRDQRPPLAQCRRAPNFSLPAHG